MPFRPLRLIQAAFLATVALSAWTVLADDSASPKSVHLVILHTNDLHGRAYPQKALWLDKVNPPDVGGLAALLATIRRERAKAWNDGAVVVLADAGDWFQGTPEGDLPRGRLVVEWMNLAGYDFATIGNHEFDKGYKTVADLSDVAHYPFLGANIRWDSGRRPDWCRGSRTFNVSGNRVTFVGLITSAMDKLVMPEAIKGLKFDDEIATLKKYLKDDGRVARGWMGMGLQNLDEDLKAALKVGKDADGVVISQVYPGFPAAEAGLESRDVITALDGQKVDSSESLVRAIGTRKPGDTVNVTLLRGGKEKVVKVTLAERPDEEALARGEFKPETRADETDKQARKAGDTALAKMGLTLEPAGRYHAAQGISGLIVTGVERDGSAEGRLRAGDVVVEINGAAVRTVDEANKALAKGDDPALFVVSRERSQRLVAVPLSK